MYDVNKVELDDRPRLLSKAADKEKPESIVTQAFTIVTTNYFVCSDS